MKHLFIFIIATTLLTCTNQDKKTLIRVAQLKVLKKGVVYLEILMILTLLLLTLMYNSPEFKLSCNLESSKPTTTYV